MTGELLRALSAAAVAEYAAVYVYGAAGPFVPATSAALAREGYDAHRSLRDEVQQRLRAAGGAVPLAPPAYLLQPRPQSTQIAFTDLAAAEDPCAAARAGVVSATDDEELRRWALAAWQDAVRRGTQWRLLGGVDRVTRPLPGLRR